VLAGISKLGYTNLNLVNPGTKVNGTYYRDVLLSQKLLPVMHDMEGEFFIFQQDSASAHTACNTVRSVRFLQQATSESILPDLWLPNCPDRNPVTWGIVQQRLYQT